MDSLDSSWDELIGRIAAGEVDDLERTLSGSGIVADPQALERAQAMLDRFWDVIQQDPGRALGVARLTAAVASARGAPAILLAEALRRQATAAFALGRARDAAALLERALTLLPGRGTDTEGAARRAALLGFLANAQLATGQPRQALIALEEAIAIAREHRLRPAQGVYLSSLGNARVTSGDTRAARAYYEEALKIAREVGNREGEAVNLNNVGLTHHALGCLANAEDHYLEALALAKSTGDPRVAATAEANLGSLHTERAELERGQRHLKAAFDLAHGLGDRSAQATVLIRLARLKRESGEPDAGLELTTQAETLLAEIEDPRCAGLWDEVGRCRLALGDAQGGAAMFERALTSARALGDLGCEAAALEGLGRAALVAGRADDAIERLEASRSRAYELDHPDLEVAALSSLAEALAAQGRPVEATARIERAQRALSERGDGLTGAWLQLSQATVQAANGDVPGAVALLERALRSARQRGLWTLAGEAERRLRALSPEKGESP